MNSPKMTFHDYALDYLKQLQGSFSKEIIQKTEELAIDLKKAWVERRQVFICGNGGSAANALHMANDFHYGIGACDQEKPLTGIRVEALPANTGVLTCLANDTGYENIYSQQLEVKANPGDLLIVLSGSGNSANVVNAIKTAKKLNVYSYAIVAFNGGECKKLANEVIHFSVNDMQIAEDTQLIIGHMCMQWLNANKPQALQQKTNARS